MWMQEWAKSRDQIFVLNTNVYTPVYICVCVIISIAPNPVKAVSIEVSMANDGVNVTWEVYMSITFCYWIKTLCVFVIGTRSGSLFNDK